MLSEAKIAFKVFVCVSGGSEQVAYYVSFGHLNKDGYLNHDTRNEKFKRYNVFLKTGTCSKRTVATTQAPGSPKTIALAFSFVFVGLRISEEPFMAGARAFLDNLKIRASHGALGNQLLGNDFYPYIPSMDVGSSPYMFTGGARTPYVAGPGLVSPSLTWETVITRNLGLDLVLLNSRLDASFDIYTRDTKNRLMSVNIIRGHLPLHRPDVPGNGWESQSASPHIRVDHLQGPNFCEIQL